MELTHPVGPPTTTTIRRRWGGTRPSAYSGFVVQSTFLEIAVSRNWAKSWLVVVLGGDMSRESEHTEIVVSIDDKHLGDLRAIVEELEKAGMEIQEVLDVARVVTGHIHFSKLRDLPKVSGVEHVEAGRKIQIPPPESSIQ